MAEPIGGGWERVMLSQRGEPERQGGENPGTGGEAAAQIAGILPIVTRQARLLSKDDRFTREDLVQEGVIAALRALDTFDPERGSLASYIGACARNRMISYLRRGMQESPMDAEKLDARAGVVSEADGAQERLEIREDLSLLTEGLSDFERTVLDAYLKGGSLAGAVKILRCDRKRADNALQRIRNKARNHDRTARGLHR